MLYAAQNIANYNQTEFFPDINLNGMINVTRYRKHLTLSPSPIHTSPSAIRVTQSPENTGLQASDSTDDTPSRKYFLLRLASCSTSLSATGMQKYKNQGMNVSLPQTCPEDSPWVESLSLLSPPVVSLTSTEIGSTMFIALCLSYSCDTHLPA